MTTIGTEVFTDFLSALKYYMTYGYSSKDLWKKIENKEILIGYGAFREKYWQETGIADADGRFHFLYGENDENN